MAQLISILLALASLALDDFGLASGWSLPFLVPALVAVPYALAAAQQRAGMRGNFKRAAWFGRVHGLAPLASQFAAVGLFGWQRSVEGWLGTRLSLLEWPHFGLLLVLAPFVFYTVAAIDADARINSEHSGLRRSLRKFQLRMFTAGLAPIATYLVLASVVGQFDGFRIQVEEVALMSAGFSGLTLLVFVFLLPFLLQHSWDTEPLAWGPERALMEEVAKLARFRCKQLFVWRTGGLMINAAIVGVTPGSRRVFFSDALLRRLGPRELAAVFAHEIGHARQHHVPLFITWAIAFFAGLDLVAAQLDPEGGALGGGLLTAGLLLWFFGFGWLSRRVELEADLYSLELLGDEQALSSALDAASPGSSRRSGWRHFGMAQRIDFLRSAAADSGVGKRLRGKLRSARWLGAILLITTLSLQFVRFADSYELDQVRADLRLGRYASAAQRVDAVEDAPADLVELIAFTRANFTADFPDRASAAQACRTHAESLEQDLQADPDLIETWRLLARLAGDEEVLLQDQSQ